jgi:alkyl hydroperoxide reductase subunit AhpC
MSLRLGDIAPAFEQEPRVDRIKFHEWLGVSWGVLFSHRPISRRSARPNLA